MIVIVLGKRGSGKTAWGLWALEKARDIFKRKVGTLFWEIEGFKAFDDIRQIPPGYFILVDEAECYVHARRGLSKSNVLAGQLAAISRHKDLSLVFITQNANFIDKQIIQLADYLIIKEPSSLAIPLERWSFVSLLSYAKRYFAGLSEEMRKKVFITYSDSVYNYLSRKFMHYSRYWPAEYVDAVIRQYSIIKGMNSLPRCWNEKISKHMRDWDGITNKEVSTLSKLPDRFTPKDIMTALNVSEVTAYRMIKEWRAFRLVKKVRKGVYEKIRR